MNRIATWKLWGELNGSQRTPVLVVVHTPELDPTSPHGDYRTLVEINGVTEARYGHGVNSLQSLVLAMQLLYVQLEYALRIGWLFYFDEHDTDPFDLLHSLTTRPGIADD